MNGTLTNLWQVFASKYVFGIFFLTPGVFDYPRDAGGIESDRWDCGSPGLEQIFACTEFFIQLILYCVNPCYEKVITIY